MSSSLSVFLGNEKRSKLTLFAYGVTDESFAINHARFSEKKWDANRAIVLNYTAFITWFLSTVAGGWGGQYIPEKAFGIDFALIAMFICLLVFQLKGRLYWIVGFFAGAFAVILSIIIPGNSYIIIASILAATFGVFLKKKALTKNTRPGDDI